MTEADRIRAVADIVRLIETADPRCGGRILVLVSRNQIGGCFEEADGIHIASAYGVTVHCEELADIPSVWVAEAKSQIEQAKEVTS